MPFEPFKRPDFTPMPIGKYKLPELKKKPEVQKPVVEKKNIFEKKKKEGGATRGEFREELKKYDSAIHLTREERLAIEKKEMLWAKFGERISEDDIKKKEKDLRKERDHLPYNIKDKTKIKAKINEKIKLLEKKLKDKK